MRNVYSKFMLSGATVKAVARECGFELAGIAATGPVEDFARYQAWVDEGHAGEMRYLTDHRAQIRNDVRNLLPTARSVICVGKLYNAPDPPVRPGDAKISRYAWGPGDYHDVLREGLERVVERLRSLHGEFEYKICVDTAPLLERSLARDAGLGWIGNNTCLINEPLGSWFFLGEIVTSLELETDGPPPGRCGTCTACIEACPTQAIVPQGDGWALDSRKCISYLTIELRGPIPEDMHRGIGDNLYGCDICQDVCPWNRKAPLTTEAAFQARPISLAELVAMTPEGFRERFRKTPVARTKHTGILRNAAIVAANGAE
jgi:epoxyqueuosine reductase